MNRQSILRSGITASAALFALILVLLGLQSSAPVAASPLGTTRAYPGPAPCDTTLQACINGSADGDVINIAAGLYITSVTLDKAVSLIGAGAGSTIIQALSNQRVLTVTAAMSAPTQIAKLTIQGGNAGASNGGGLYLLGGAQPLIQDIIVSTNFAQSGGGIYAVSPITLVKVNVANNAATNGSGGGLYGVGDVLATDSDFQYNTVITNGYGGGVFAGANFTGTNVTFTGNIVNNGYDGGGLYAAGAVKLTAGNSSTIRRLSIEAMAEAAA